jgi:hypothetical protein
MTEPGATIAGSSSAMINQSSISSFSTIVLFQFFFLSLCVCHKGCICNNYYLLLCVFLFYFAYLGNLAPCGTFTKSRAAEWRKIKVKYDCRRFCA